MNILNPIIARAQRELALLLKAAIKQGPATPDLYARYLSMQYHLNRGVQRYFITAAAHGDLSKRKKLRKFLLDFANEEELHYIVAANDLHKLGLTVLPEPFDVTLWHSYFEKIVVERPFVRLGAACVLENISGGEAKPFIKEALAASFLNRENTKYLVLHQHETIPHGDQIIEALASSNLDDHHVSDLLEGAQKGLIFYIRMAEWALNPDSLSALADASEHDFKTEDKKLIEDFSMELLDA